jgi:hypothetical protein
MSGVGCSTTATRLVDAVRARASGEHAHGAEVLAAACSKAEQLLTYLRRLPEKDTLAHSLPMAVGPCHSLLSWAQ